METLHVLCLGLVAISAVADCYTVGSITVMPLPDVDDNIVVETDCPKGCEKLEEGLYASCKGCDRFMLCQQGQMYDTYICPDGLVWDDVAKDCLNESSTCTCYERTTPAAPATTTTTPDAPATTTTPAAPETTVSEEEDNVCITSCSGLKEGDYQSCQGCHVYATCANGWLYDGRPCPATTVWDDNEKKCLGSSTTCP